MRVAVSLNSPLYRLLTWCLVVSMTITACVAPAAPVSRESTLVPGQPESTGASKPKTETPVTDWTPTADQSPESREHSETPQVVELRVPSNAPVSRESTLVPGQPELTGASKPKTETPVTDWTPTVDQSPESREHSETPQVVKLRIPSNAPDSRVTVSAVTSTPTPAVTPTTFVEATPTVPADAEPVILTGLGVDRVCGHGDVVAIDGHSLRATPRLLPGNSNFLELLPEETRVGIIDCRLWTDQEGLSWLAVRTGQGKLGWMLVQPDKFYVTLYPVPLDPPKALTGIPAGTTIAYVPPSECKSGPVSDEAVATSIGIDLIPVVGDVKGLVEVATGCDLVTGESLGDWRWLGLLGLVGLAEVALLRHGDEVADSARMVDNLEGSLRYSDEAAIATGRNIDTAADLIRGASKLEDVADTAADAARTADKSAGLSDEALQALAKFEEPCSFSADTLVSTQTGLVPISEIGPGDLVLAYDESVKATGFYTVTATSAHLDPLILIITIGSDVLEATPEHPFYVREQWVPAGDLEVGDAVTMASGASDLVWGTQTAYQPQIMYNLTIAKAHTYFVGFDQWLVHNACSRILRSNLISVNKVPDWGDEVQWQAHHVVPGEFEDHPFIREATKGGWKVDEADNGLALPYLDDVAETYGLPSHRGYHARYSDDVEREFNVLNQTRIREGWGSQRSARELEKLVDRLRGKILGMPGGQHLQ